MLSLILIKHGNLVDLNRAFYVIHRRNRLDYRIDPVTEAMDQSVQTVRTYPTSLLVAKMDDGWSMVRGNSCFDFAPIARALSGALSTRAFSVIHQPLHEECGVCLCEAGRELRRIVRRHGRTAASGTVQPFEQGDELVADSSFGLDELATYAQWAGAPIDLRGDFALFPPNYHIHSV